MVRLMMFRSILAKILLTLLFLFWQGQSALAQILLGSEAREAILMDADTHTILFEKNADALMPPASMSKLMTIVMVMDRLADGSLKMEDTFPVSEAAWRMQGSKMFVELGAQIPVADLLRGIIVQSGNDACVVVAEGIGGDEQTFARMMTERARQIGLTHSVFRNSSGWPDPEHVMTARDLAILSDYIITRHKQYYSMFAEIDFTWHGIKQGNRNPLLYSFPGADGLKTGHTEEAGYGLVGSAVRDGRRLIVVVTGMESDRKRGIEAARLLTLGFGEFDNYTLVKAGQKVEDADVWLGSVKKVPLVAAREVKLTLPRAARKELKAKLVYQAPLPAPLEKGAEAGVINFTAPGMAPVSVPVVTGDEVEKLSFLSKIPAAFNYLMWGPGG
jgi:serine-type D-Ala-D-Ala carboxypeptidase (penicillin-binding protein 5/6)